MTGTPVVPLAVISPVRDEAKYVRNTLDAMLAQTVRPQEWLFVDDGSRDDTRAIVESYCSASIPGSGLSVGKTAVFANWVPA